MNVIDRFLKKCEIKKGRTLIVGSKIHEGTEKPDRRKKYTDALGVDMEDGEGVDRVCDLEEDDSLVESFESFGFGAYSHAELERFAHVECTSVLEHSRRPWLLCANLERLMQDDATIIVMVPWVWRVHNYPGDYFRFTPEAIGSLLPSIQWERMAYIVEGRLSEDVPTLNHRGIRYMARSELIMFGRKCVSTS